MFKPEANHSKGTSPPPIYPPLIGRKREDAIKEWS